MHWMVLALSFLILVGFFFEVSYPILTKTNKTQQKQKMKVCDDCWEIKHLIILCCMENGLTR